MRLGRAKSSTSVLPANPESHDREVGDARLVDGLRRKSPSALADLYKQHAAGIYSLALRLVRQPHDAEDITHDVLIRAYERIPRRREVQLRPWLYRLTMNRCYDHLRATARRPTPHEGVSDRPCHSDPFAHSEMAQILESTLCELTARQRAAMLLKDVHGLTLVEVAECLDITPGSTEVLLARARNDFRARFTARCRAEGHAAPSSAARATVLALPLLPLPASFAPPLAVVPPLVAGALPAALAGGGIGAAAGLPASFKTAVLIVAAAAAIGTTEMGTTHEGSSTPRRASQEVARVEPAPPAPGAAVTSSAAPHPSATPSEVASPGSSRTADEPETPSASPSAEPTEAAETENGLTPHGAPSPSTTPGETEPPLASPTPSVTPSVSPSPSLSPSPTVAPSPQVSPSPGSTPAADASPAS